MIFFVCRISAALELFHIVFDSKTTRKTTSIRSINFSRIMVDEIFWFFSPGSMVVRIGRKRSSDTNGPKMNCLNHKREILVQRWLGMDGGVRERNTFFFVSRV